MAGGTSDLSYHATLAAATVDTVILQFPGCSTFEVVNRDATATIFVTYLKVTPATAVPADPTAGGNNTFVVPPNSSKQLQLGLGGQGNLVVKLISAGTPAYSVEVLA